MIKKSPKEFLTYSNSEYNFKVDYPDNWRIKFPKTEGEFVVEFISRSEGIEDLFIERAHVIVENLTPPITLEEWTKIVLEDYKKKYEDNKNKKFTIISETNSFLSGQKAHQLIFREEYGVWDNKAMQIWTIVGGNVYTFGYYALTKDYDKYMEIITKMIGSLQIDTP